MEKSEPQEVYIVINSKGRLFAEYEKDEANAYAKEYDLLASHEAPHRAVCYVPAASLAAETERRETAEACCADLGQMLVQYKHQGIVAFERALTSGLAQKSTAIGSSLLVRLAELETLRIATENEVGLTLLKHIAGCECQCDFEVGSYPCEGCAAKEYFKKLESALATCSKKKKE